jgi:hypothetical protein
MKLLNIITSILCLCSGNGFLMQTSLSKYKREILKLSGQTHGTWTKSNFSKNTGVYQQNFTVMNPGGVSSSDSSYFVQTQQNKNSKCLH